MVLNTFEGITLDTLPDKDRDYDYAVGYLTTIKQRDSNTFISMSIAGSNASDRGAAFGMLRYRPFEGLSTILMNYYLPDFVNTGFGQAEYTFQRAKDRPDWILGANMVWNVPEVSRFCPTFCWSMRRRPNGFFVKPLLNPAGQRVGS